MVGGDVHHHQRHPRAQQKAAGAPKEDIGRVWWYIDRGMGLSHQMTDIICDDAQGFYQEDFDGFLQIDHMYIRDIHYITSQYFGHYLLFILARLDIL